MADHLGRLLASRRPKRIISAVSGTILGNAGGAVLPFVIAAWFGAGSTTDAYFYALGTILFLNSVVSLAVESSTTPHIVILRADGPLAVRRFLRRTALQGATAATVVTAAGLAVVVYLVLPQTSFTHEQRHAIVVTLKILSFLPPLVTINSMLAGTQYAYQRFILGTSTVSLRSIVALVLGFGFRHSLGINAVAYGLVVGEALRFGILWYGVRRLITSEERRQSTPRAAGNVASALTFWRTVTPQVLAVSLGAVGLLVDKTVAATLGVGRVTIVELAQRMVYTPVLLLASGVGLVLGTAWAQLLTRGDTQALRREFVRAQAAVLAVSILLTLCSTVVVWVARPFLDSAFGLRNPSLAALTFTLAAAGIPAAMAAQLGVRLLIAARRTAMFPVFAVAATAANLALDILFARLIGVAGIALASACVNVFTACCYITLSWRFLTGSDGASKMAGAD